MFRLPQVRGQWLLSPRIASPDMDNGMDTRRTAKKKSNSFLFLLSLMLFIIIGTGCGDQFESYRTTLDVPSDLQRVQLTNPDNIIDKLQYTSEEALLFFSQCDGIELETVPPAEVRKYQETRTGIYVYEVDLYGSESSISYEFALPYIKLPNGDWSIVLDAEFEYDMSTTILSLPSDHPHGTTIWDISKFSN